MVQFKWPCFNGTCSELGFRIYLFFIFIFYKWGTTFSQTNEMKSPVAEQTFPQGVNKWHANKMTPPSIMHVQGAWEPVCVGHSVSHFTP